MSDLNEKLTNPKSNISPLAVVTSNSIKKELTLNQYKCDKCSTICNKPSVLKKHLRKHTNERPYPCLLCERSFKTKSNLTKHEKSKSHLSQMMKLKNVKEMQESLTNVDSSKLLSQYHRKVEFDSYEQCSTVTESEDVSGVDDDDNLEDERDEPEDMDEDEDDDDDDDGQVTTTSVDQVFIKKEPADTAISCTTSTATNPHNLSGVASSLCSATLTIPSSDGPVCVQVFLNLESVRPLLPSDQAVIHRSNHPDLFQSNNGSQSSSPPPPPLQPQQAHMQSQSQSQSRTQPPLLIPSTAVSSPLFTTNRNDADLRAAETILHMANQRPTTLVTSLAISTATHYDAANTPTTVVKSNIKISPTSFTSNQSSSNTLSFLINQDDSVNALSSISTPTTAGTPVTSKKNITPGYGHSNVTSNVRPIKPMTPGQSNKTITNDDTLTSHTDKANRKVLVKQNLLKKMQKKHQSGSITPVGVQSQSDDNSCLPSSSSLRPNSIQLKIPTSNFTNMGNIANSGSFSNSPIPSAKSTPTTNATFLLLPTSISSSTSSPIIGSSKSLHNTPTSTNTTTNIVLVAPSATSESSIYNPANSTTSFIGTPVTSTNHMTSISTINNNNNNTILLVSQSPNSINITTTTPLSSSSSSSISSSSSTLESQAAILSKVISNTKSLHLHQNNLISSTTNTASSSTSSSDPIHLISNSISDLPANSKLLPQINTETRPIMSPTLSEMDLSPRLKIVEDEISIRQTITRDKNVASSGPLFSEHQAVRVSISNSQMDDDESDEEIDVVNTDSDDDPQYHRQRKWRNLARAVVPNRTISIDKSNQKRRRTSLNETDASNKRFKDSTTTSQHPLYNPNINAKDLLQDCPLNLSANRLPTIAPVVSNGHQPTVGSVIQSLCMSISSGPPVSCPSNNTYSTGGSCTNTHQFIFSDDKRTCDICQQIIDSRYFKVHMDMHRFTDKDNQTAIEVNQNHHQQNQQHNQHHQQQQHNQHQSMNLNINSTVNGCNSFNNNNSIPTNHNDSINSNQRPRSYRCSVCNIAFRVNGHLRKHHHSKGHLSALVSSGYLSREMSAKIEQFRLPLHRIIDHATGNIDPQALQACIKDYDPQSSANSTILITSTTANLITSPTTYINNISNANNITTLTNPLYHQPPSSSSSTLL